MSAEKTLGLYDECQAVEIATGIGIANVPYDLFSIPDSDGDPDPEKAKVCWKLSIG